MAPQFSHILRMITSRNPYVNDETEFPRLAENYRWRKRGTEVASQGSV